MFRTVIFSLTSGSIPSSIISAITQCSPSRVSPRKDRPSCFRTVPENRGKNCVLTESRFHRLTSATICPYQITGLHYLGIAFRSRQLRNNVVIILVEALEFRVKLDFTPRFPQMIAQNGLYTSLTQGYRRQLCYSSVLNN